MPGPHEIAFEAYGVPLVVVADSAELLPRILQTLPPGWNPADAESPERRFTLRTEDGVTYVVRYEGGAISGSADLDVALDVLESLVRSYVALHAPELIFVHAGVVAHGDRAILIPGVSFSGKSTLVAELVRAGATYYSDEFAVLDAEGRTLPYAKPLALRNGTLSQTNHRVETLGGIAGEAPAPVGLVAVTRYRPRADWRPERRSAGQGVLALMANTIPARERPEESLSAIRNAVDGALVLEGERGEAAPVVEQLLEYLA